MKVVVIIPAAGLGTRMALMPPGNKGKPKAPSKQFTELGGTPILIHTLRKFAGRTMAGICFTSKPAHGGAKAWYVSESKTSQGGESGDSGESAIASLTQGETGEIGRESYRDRVGHGLTSVTRLTTDSDTIFPVVTPFDEEGTTP